MPNNTVHQHYISRVELAMNRVSGSEPNSVFGYVVTDKEKYSVERTKPAKQSTRDSLVYDDLFTVGFSDGTSHNLEDSFTPYEKIYLKNAIDLYRNATIGSFKIVAKHKWMSSFRNPHRVNKTLNTIGDIQKYRPIKDKDLAKRLEEIRQGNISRPIIESNPDLLTEEQFDQLLYSLIMSFQLVTDEQSGIVLFDALFDGLFSNSRT